MENHKKTFFRDETLQHKNKVDAVKLEKDNNINLTDILEQFFNGSEIVQKSAIIRLSQLLMMNLKDGGGTIAQKLDIIKSFTIKKSTYQTNLQHSYEKQDQTIKEMLIEYFSQSKDMIGMDELKPSFVRELVGIISHNNFPDEIKDIIKLIKKSYFNQYF